MPLYLAEISESVHDANETRIRQREKLNEQLVSGITGEQLLKIATHRAKLDRQIDAATKVTTNKEMLSMPAQRSLERSAHTLKRLKADFIVRLAEDYNRRVQETEHSDKRARFNAVNACTTLGQLLDYMSNADWRNKAEQYFPIPRGV